MLDDFSRFIVAWKLCATMKAQDVTATPLDLALAASGLDQMNVVHRPRLFCRTTARRMSRAILPIGWTSRTSTCPRSAVSSADQARSSAGIKRSRDRILLEHYYLPGDLERQVAAFVEHYNHARYHESLGNLNPADVYFGRAETSSFLERERIKRQTIANRRLQHHPHVMPLNLNH